MLDFGLAAVAQGTEAPHADTHSPTLTIAATLAGVILGTAAYMSPEQAAGKPRRQARRHLVVWRGAVGEC